MCHRVSDVIPLRGSLFNVLFHRSKYARGDPSDLMNVFVVRTTQILMGMR